VKPVPLAGCCRTNTDKHCALSYMQFSAWTTAASAFRRWAKTGVFFKL